MTKEEKCPWCGEEIEFEYLYEETGGYYKTEVHCPHCEKEIVVLTEVTFLLKKRN
ncbi:MAG: hypothetical protein ACFFCS_27540 [Candidatus Hodarchaeota archaeon]